MYSETRSAPTYCRVVLSVAFLLLVPGHMASAVEEKQGTRFVVIGHLYPIAEDAGLMAKTYEKINAAEPDYVFILGDSCLEKDGMAAAYEENIDAEVYYSPGNHELHTEETRERYMKNVGYLEKTVEAGDCRFLIVNSSESAAHINGFVREELAGTTDDKVMILMAHHRIWDDTLVSDEPYQHDKSFAFSEVFDVLDGRVGYIFAGNSKRQYFADLQKSPNWGRQNVNNIYWCDMVGSVQCISVGMGEGRPKAGFVIAEVVGDSLLLSADFVLTEGEDPVSAELVQPHRPRPLDVMKQKPASTPRERATRPAQRASAVFLRRLRQERLFWGVGGVCAGAIVAGAAAWIALRRKCRDKGAA